MTVFEVAEMRVGRGEGTLHLHSMVRGRPLNHINVGAVCDSLTLIMTYSTREHH